MDMRNNSVLARLRRLGAFIALMMLWSAPASAQTKITIATFAGATNLPVWMALDRGYFTREGLEVTHEVTRGSTAAIEGLMSGRLQFASIAFDNTIANAEGQGDVNIPGYDLVGIMGVHSGMNKIVTRPEIKSFADIRGKAVASDALNSGYGIVLVRILEMNGLVYGRDFTSVAVGSGPNRLKAMQDGKAVAAALSSPDDIEAKKLGFNILADATEAIGAYQGSAFVVRRAWAREHEKETLAFIRAVVAATNTVFADKPAAIAVMRGRIKGLSEADAEAVYTDLVTSKGGLNRAAKINMDGVKMLLSLRNQFGEPKKTLTDPSKYIDLSYYEKAMAK
ncbi:MAG: transporter substrate-binding protein [Hyphomicrobiales bacterium]|nr:transporter substrate-binding protein [Hyphomicrobiales bacterium]